MYMTENHPERMISAVGVKLIKSFEQLRLWPYQDMAGNWTIGYGHLIRSNEHFIVINQAQADQLFSVDVSVAVHAVCNLVRVPLSQNQFDALCSFVFNVGTRNFQYSTLLSKLNFGDYAGAAQQFRQWDKVTVDGVLVPSTGLLRRRQAEEQLFLWQQQAA
jgi:lysozyme